MTKKKKKRRRKKITENEIKELNGLKEEVARDLGLDDDIARRGWANISSRETGKIGGHMAQRLRRKERNKPDPQEGDPGES